MKYTKYAPISIALLMTLAWAMPATSAEDSQPFAGTFELARGEAKAKKTIAAAIDEVVGEMFVVKRPFARDKLEESTEPCSTLQFSFPQNKIRVRCEDKPPTLTPDDDKRVPYKAEDGTVYQVRQKQSGRILRQIFYSENGKRINTMHLSDDGDSIEMSVRIESDKLPEPLEYELTFERRSSS